MKIRDRLAVKERHGSAELPKSDEGLVRRAELARATPRSNPKSKETKRRVFGVFGGTYDFGVFLAVHLPFIFYGKMEGSRAGTQAKTPTPIANLSPERRVGLACWRLRRAGFD